MIKKLNFRYICTFLAIILGVFAIYFKALSSAPFGDDFGFVFHADAITKSPHPFVYWFTNTDLSRSWPLTYSIFWSLYKLFGEKFVYYKIINLFIHLLNGFLVLKIFQKLGIKYWFLAVLIFLAHPMNVESIVWIFQLKTLLSVTFFLCSYLFFLDFMKDRSGNQIVGALVFFMLSMLTKITAIMMPILFLIHLLKEGSFTRKKSALIVLPFFIVALLSAYTSIEGTVGYSRLELNKNQTFHEQAFSPIRPVINHSAILKAVAQKPDNGFNGVIGYFNVFSFETLMIKIGIAMNATVFYVRKFFAFDNFYPIYPNLNFRELMPIINIIIFMVLVVICIFFGGFSFIPISFYLLAIFPVAGIFYVPYMKNSYVADHWCYLGLIGLCGTFACIFERLMRKIKVRKVALICVGLFITFLSIRTYLYSTEFADQESLFAKNLKINPTSNILYEYLLPIKKQKQQILDIHELILVIYGRSSERFDLYNKMPISPEEKFEKQSRLIKLYLLMGYHEMARLQIHDLMTQGRNDKDAAYFHAVAEILVHKDPSTVLENILFK